MIDGTPNLLLAPGCYGLALTYRDDARECKICPFRASCAPLAAESLVILRSELGIAGLVKKALRKKPPGELTRAERVRQALVAAIKRCENPFKSGKPAYLKVAFYLLLNMRHGISREALAQAFIGKLSYSPRTAIDRVTHTVAFIQRHDIGGEFDGKIYLKVE